MKLTARLGSKYASGYLIDTTLFVFQDKLIIESTMEFEEG